MLEDSCHDSQEFFQQTAISSYRDLDIQSHVPSPVDDEYIQILSDQKRNEDTHLDLNDNILNGQVEFTLVHSFT